MQYLKPLQPAPEVSTTGDEDTDESTELQVNKATLQVAIDALTHIRKRLNAQKAAGGAAKKPRLV